MLSGFILFHLISVVSPCDDYYSSVCNAELLQKTNLQFRSFSISSLHAAEEKIRVLETKALKDLASSLVALGPRRGLRDLFRLCLDETARQKEEQEIIRRVLKGGWGVELLGSEKIRPKNEREKIAFEKMLLTLFEELELSKPNERAKSPSDSDFKIFDTLHSRITFSLPKFRQARLDFMKTYRGGIVSMPSLEFQCVETMHVHFGRELGFEVRNQLGWERFRSHAESLFSDLKSRMVQRIEKLDWMSPETKAETNKKLKTLDLKLGAPRLADEWGLAKLPKISARSHFIETLEKALALRRLPAGAWVINPLEVNAVYDARANAIYIPAAVLQAPFVEKSKDQFMDVGLRFIMAHELAHIVEYSIARPSDQAHWDHKLYEWQTVLEPLGYKSSVSREALADHWGLSLAQESSRLSAAEFYREWASLWCALFTPEASEFLKSNFAYPLGADRVNPQLQQDSTFRKTYRCENDGRNQGF